MSDPRYAHDGPHLPLRWQCDGIADEPAVLAAQRTQHLVFDIDGTLLHTFERGEEPVWADDRHPDVRGADFESYLRPGALLLLRLAFRRYASVSLWTAATEEYARDVARNLLRLVDDERARFTLVWSRLHCSFERPDPTRYGADDVGTRKPLARFWAAPSLRHRANAYNTWMLEDTPTNGVANPRNIVAVRRYDAKAVVWERDDLSMVCAWRELLARAQPYD